MQKPGQRSAIISSTAIDLPEHRKQVLEACLAAGFFPLCMESLPARDADAIRASLDLVDGANVYIGIFAFRYGHVPADHEVSITEMEFNRAVERKIPILLFLIHSEHLITIEMVETGDQAQKKLAALKKRACQGRNRREFKSASELRAHVIQALAALKEEQAQLSSPTDSIRLMEQELQRLDPRFSVRISATGNSMNVQLRPAQPGIGLPPLTPLREDKVGDLKAFIEKGEPFRINAAEVRIEGAPIHNELLRAFGNVELTFHGLAIPGNVQFHFGSPAEPLCIQIDGEWVVAPRRTSFRGLLTGSPLSVECIREKLDDDNWGLLSIHFRFGWGAWAGQRLQALPYFPELYALLQEKELFVRFYFMGRQQWPGAKLLVENPERDQGFEAIKCIQTCQRVAQRVGANPLFPPPNEIGQIEAEDVRLLVELLEHGKHEQVNAGQITEISCDAPPAGSEPPKDAPCMTLPEPLRNFNFLGVAVALGPLLHTWTNMEFLESRPAEDGRVRLVFRGTESSMYCVEYKTD